MTNKAREKEDGILKQLELAVAMTLQVDLGELEERWKSELLDRHKEELMQNQQYRLLPEPMKTVDSFASTAVAAASRTARAAATEAAAVSVLTASISHHTKFNSEVSRVAVGLNTPHQAIERASGATEMRKTQERDRDRQHTPQAECGFASGYRRWRRAAARRTARGARRRMTRTSSGCC